MRTYLLSLSAARVVVVLLYATCQGGIAAADSRLPIPSDWNLAPSAAAQRFFSRTQNGVHAVSRPGKPAPAAASAAAADLDVVVNDPSLDVPEMTTQSETTLAVNGSTICAGYNDTGDGGLSGLSVSPDLGTTWLDRGGLGQVGDPVLAVHRSSGVFYYAELASIDGVEAIGVARSVDDCRTFPTLANASAASSSADGFQDKPWIAVDNTGGDRDGFVYACWTSATFEDDAIAQVEIRFSRSTDGGLTFGDERVISPDTDIGPFGCHIDVGPAGEVYAAWADRDQLGGSPIRFRRSLDGGIGWDPPVQVSTEPIEQPGTERPAPCGIGFVSRTLNGDIGMYHQAWMAVDTSDGPSRGNIYVVWANDPPGGVDNSDVLLSRSTDGGATWSVERQLGGDTPTDQFEPFVEVAGDGTLAVAWYDRRNDPEDNLLIDVFTTFSRDGGATFDPLVRVTDVSFPVPPLTSQPGQPGAIANFDPAARPCYMGEYIAIAADGDNFYYAWGDNRNTVVSSDYPDGRPDPDVFFARLPIPAEAPTVTPTPTPNATPTPTTRGCAGDCDGDGNVSIAELIEGVGILLSASPAGACSAFDIDGDDRLDVGEMIAAVSSALKGCERTPGSG